MSCKGNWEQIAAEMESAAKVAPGQVDGALRCNHAGCDKLVLRNKGVCLAGHTQEGAAAPVAESFAGELGDALLCLVREVGEKRLFTDGEEDPRMQEARSILEILGCREAAPQAVDLILEVMHDRAEGEWEDDPRLRAARAYIAERQRSAGGSPKVQWHGQELSLRWETYQEGDRPALMLVDDSGEVRLTATTNMPDVMLQDGFVIIKDYGENTGIVAALEQAGIVQATGQRIPAGRTTVAICQLLVTPPPAPLEPQPAGGQAERIQRMQEALIEATVKGEYQEWDGVDGEGWEAVKDLWLQTPHGADDEEREDEEEVEWAEKAKFHRFLAGVAAGLAKEHPNWSFRGSVEVDPDDMTRALLLGQRLDRAGPEVVLAQVERAAAGFYYPDMGALSQDLEHTYQEATTVLRRVDPPVLTHPLSGEELAAQADEDGYVRAVLRVDAMDLQAADGEEWWNWASEQITGSSLMEDMSMRVVGYEPGDHRTQNAGNVLLEIQGDVSEILNEMAQEEQFPGE